jgi:hypothetical protein
MGSPVVIFNSAGTPEPPTDIVRRLAAIHPDLALYFSPQTPKHWMVTMQWPAEDRRWAMVQRQEISGEKTFSILGFLPLDCPVQDAPSYIERYLRTSTEESARNLTQYVNRFNENVPQAMVESAMEEVFAGGDPSGVDKRKGRRTVHKKI